MFWKPTKTSAPNQGEEIGHLLFQCLELRHSFLSRATQGLVIVRSAIKTYQVANKIRRNQAHQNHHHHHHHHHLIIIIIIMSTFSPISARECCWHQSATGNISIPLIIQSLHNSCRINAAIIFHVLMTWSVQSSPLPSLSLESAEQQQQQQQHRRRQQQ